MIQPKFPRMTIGIALGGAALLTLLFVTPIYTYRTANTPCLSSSTFRRTMFIRSDSQTSIRAEAEQAVKRGYGADLCAASGVYTYRLYML